MKELMSSSQRISGISGIAASRLVTVGTNALLVNVAKQLTRSQVSLVVVCNPDGAMAGVITKSDLIRQMASCPASACQTVASDIMTRDVTFCYDTDKLEDVLLTLQTQGLVHLPLIASNHKPVGVVNARDALRSLLKQEQYDESLLRNYVMGVGYQ